MKKIVLLLFTTVLITNVFAQSKYEKTMENALAELDSIHNPEIRQKLLGLFERIAAKETDKWRPLYYASYMNLMTGMFEEKKKNQDLFYDKAIEYATKANELNKDNDEILTLLAFAYQMKISVKPAKRGAKLGAIANEKLAKAEKINPENPRVYILKADNLYYTPKMWGGDKEKAIETYKLAEEKFNAFKPKHKLDPNWGLYRVKEMIATDQKSNN